ncbi:hypothetical protein [Sphingopyxis sp. 550A]
MNNRLVLLSIGIGSILAIAAFTTLIGTAPPGDPHADPILLPGQGPEAKVSPSASTLPSEWLVDPSGIAPEIELEILRDAGDPAAKLRGVKLAGDRQQVACGEILATNSRKYAKFVWLADASKVVADDGKGLYAQVAPLCDGKGLP